MGVCVNSVVDEYKELSMDTASFRAMFAKAPEKFPKGLEVKYPRVLQLIISKWDAPRELEAYLNELVVDQRGNRAGFPTEILQEILFLAALFERWRAERKRKAEPAILALISISQVDGLERGQKPNTPELVKALNSLKLSLSKDNVEQLLDKQDLFNQRDRDGMTLLMHAACYGAEKSLIHLLKSGANPHVHDNAANKPLHWAVTMGKLRSTEILLYFGADPMAKNNAGASALTLAAIKADASIAARLIDYGADPNSPDGRGDFPLHKAVSSGLVETTRFLLYAGASKEMRNRDGKTPLELGIKPEIAKVFQEHHSEMMKSSMR